MHRSAFLLVSLCTTLACASSPSGTTGSSPSARPARSQRAETRAEPGKLRGIVAAHNRVRAQVGVPPMTWSDDVARVAQRWADHLAARRCKLEHNGRARLGENLFWSSGPADATQVVAAWAAEKQSYSYRTNSCRGVCGHYTQVVWAKSTQVGCGMATCGSAEVWVCNYDPAGNLVGARPY
jgi:pathogenesis-related protein 1